LYVATIITPVISSSALIGIKSDSQIINFLQFHKSFLPMLCCICLGIVNKYDLASFINHLRCMTRNKGHQVGGHSKKLTNLVAFVTQQSKIEIVVVLIFYMAFNRLPEDANDHGVELFKRFHFITKRAGFLCYVPFKTNRIEVNKQQQFWL